MTTKGESSPTGHSGDGEMLKLPLKRFEVVFHKFSQVAIPLHLDLLNKHKDNIGKYQRLHEWDRVHREQVNASRTVQQLTADIWEMDRVRQQVRLEDLPEFDRRIGPLKTRAVGAITDFLNEHKDVGKPQVLLLRNAKMKGMFVDEEDDEEEDIFNQHNQKQTTRDDSCNGEIQEDENEAIESKRTVANSWRSLYSDLLALNQMIRGYSEAVHAQQPEVVQIEQNLEDTANNVTVGSRYLGRSVKLKTAMLPVVGAAIGCLAGPVGLVIGLKMGAAAAIGGGFLGFAGGKYLKNRNETAAEVELQQLSQNNSEPVPVLASGSEELRNLK